MTHFYSFFILLAAGLGLSLLIGAAIDSGRRVVDLNPIDLDKLDGGQK